MHAAPRSVPPDFRLYALSTSAPVKWKDPDVDEDDIHMSTLVKTRKANAMAKGAVEQVFSVRLLVPGTLECAWQYFHSTFSRRAACM